MSTPLFLRANTAAEIYVHALSSAYRSGFRIYDPSPALAKDPNIYEKLMLDAVIYHAVQQRRHMVAGHKFQCQPASESTADKIWAAICEKLIGRIRNFKGALFNLANAVFVGSTYGMIRGERKFLTLIDGKPRNWFVPLEVKDVSKFRFRPVPKRVNEGTADEQINIEWQIHNVARDTFEPLEHPECFIKHIYDDNESSLGFGRGLVDAMYYYWRAKELVLTENVGAIEFWARGLLIAKIDGVRDASTGKTNQALLDNVLTQLEKHRGRHVLGMGKEDEVTVTDGPGEGWQMAAGMRDYLDQALRTLILGSSLPTGGGEQGGSYALGKVQENSTEALIQYDREILSETISNDLIGLLRRLNQPQLLEMGIGHAENPKFLIVQEKIQNPKERAEIAALYVDRGIPLKEDELYEPAGFTVPGPEDKVFVKAQPQIDPLTGFPMEPPPGGKRGDAPEGSPPGRNGRPGPNDEKGPERQPKEREEAAAYEAGRRFQPAPPLPTVHIHQAPITVNQAPIHVKSPDVHVTPPKPPDVHLYEAEQKEQRIIVPAPVVHVHPEVRGPEVHAHMPEQPPIVVPPATVVVQPEVKAPDVHVNLPAKKPVELVVTERDREGNIKKITPQEVK